MDKEHNIFKMVINMKESLKKIKDLEKENIILFVVKNMKENIKMIYIMVKM